MKKYIVFGWSRDSILPDELLGTTTEIVEELIPDGDNPNASYFALTAVDEPVQLSKKLFSGKTFDMKVFYSHNIKHDPKTGKKIVAYYEIPNASGLENND